MKTIRNAYVASLVLLAVSAAGSASAQHIHQNHPTSPHMGPWIRILLLSDWAGNKSVKTTSETLDVLFERRFDNCTCEQVDIEIEEKEERTHEVSVTGSYTQGSSAEASAKLLAGEVKAAAHASVTIGGGYKWTKKHTYTITQSTTNPKCNTKDFKSTIKRYTAFGTMDTADHKVICKNTETNASADNFCNKKTITSNGVGFQGQVDKWQQVGPCEPCPCDEPVPDVEEEPVPDEGGDPGGPGDTGAGDGDDLDTKIE